MTAPPILAREDIAGLIPHSGAMSLLDRVVEMTPSYILCEADSHCDPQNPLRDQGVLPISAAIEYAAQAIAVHGALSSKAATPQPGFLAVITNVTWSVDRLDVVSGPLRIHAEKHEGTAAGVRYQVRVAAGGRDLLWGDLLIAMLRALPV